MYRPLAIASIVYGLVLPAVAGASEYAGVHRLSYADLPSDPAPVLKPANDPGAGPLQPFLRLDGEAETGSVDALAAGLRVDGADWRLKGELEARPMATGLVPTLGLATSWRLGRQWQLSSQLASLPLDDAPDLGAGRIRLAARRTGPAGAWDEFSLQRRAGTHGWSDDLALAAHRTVLQGASERLSVTGRIVSRERADAEDRAFSLSLDHRWEAWAHADMRMEQEFTVGLGGHRSGSDLRATGNLRYGHVWEIGDRLDLEYAIERENRPGATLENDGTMLSVGFTGTF